MAVVAPSSAIPTKAPSPRLCPSSSSPPRRLNYVEKKMMMMMMTSRKAAFGAAYISQSTFTLSNPRSLTVSASKSQDDQLNLSADNPEPAFTFKEDLNYLLKLGGGSILGAAIIKYGSILLPEITRPNIVQALVMISSPVIVATLLFIKESRNQ